MTDQVRPSSSLHWLDTATRALGCEWVDRRGRDGWCETHEDVWPCGRAQEAAEVIAADVAEVAGRLEAERDRLAATVARVEALAEQMASEHGQSWNSIAARRVSAALSAVPREDEDDPITPAARLAAAAIVAVEAVERVVERHWVDLADRLTRQAALRAARAVPREESDE